MMKKIGYFCGVAVVSLGLITGCASMGGSASNSPTEVIAQAKTATDKAKAANYEWRDTAKIIKKAEAALKAGDEAGALKLANQALEQSTLALSQAKSEGAKFLSNN